MVFRKSTDSFAEGIDTWNLMCRVHVDNKFRTNRWTKDNSGYEINVSNISSIFSIKTDVFVEDDCNVIVRLAAGEKEFHIRGSYTYSDDPCLSFVDTVEIPNFEKKVKFDSKKSLLDNIHKAYDDILSSYWSFICKCVAENSVFKEWFFNAGELAAHIKPLWYVNGAML